LQFEVSSVRSERACAQPSDFRLHTSNSRSTPPRGCVQNEANRGLPSKKAQNEPNRGQATGAPRRIVQNEAKLGKTGECGQRELLRGAWLGRGVKRAKRTQFHPGRRQMHKTNPISPRRKRLTEEILQNEAKLGKTGGCGQRELLRGAWLGRGVKRAKRTQFRPSAREWARAGGPRCPAGGRLCKTEPILGVNRLPNAARTLRRSCGENVGVSRVLELS
jgi:hypothetical protein